jgi:hypothetical protein
VARARTVSSTRLEIRVACTARMRSRSAVQSQRPPRCAHAIGVEAAAPAQGFRSGSPYPPMIAEASAGVGRLSHSSRASGIALDRLTGRRRPRGISVRAEFAPERWPATTIGRVAMGRGWGRRVGKRRGDPCRGGVYYNPKPPAIQALPCPSVRNRWSPCAACHDRVLCNGALGVSVAKSTPLRCDVVLFVAL